MPTWGGILGELRAAQAANDPAPFDTVRRKYLVEAAQYLDRSVILYASNWTRPGLEIPADLLSITDEDLQGFMEVLHRLPGPNLDLVVHSPGGSAEAAEAIVIYLRSRFTHIRVVVPSLAMSAASMLACAADEIVLGAHSFLGPTDPQFFLATPLGQRLVPAQAILDQFRFAQQECADSARLASWLPMLNQYGPDLLIQCQDALDRSRQLVEEWLAQYMLKDESDGPKKAAEIAGWLSDHSHFKTHARHISRDELRRHGIRVVDLEGDQKAQDLLLSIFHATTHTFDSTGTVKIIENHLGKAFLKMQQTIPIQIGPAGHGGPPIVPQVPGQKPKSGQSRKRKR